MRVLGGIILAAPIIGCVCVIIYYMAITWERRR